jgi:hypothetical protein
MTRRASSTVSGSMSRFQATVMSDFQSAQPRQPAMFLLDLCRAR